MDLSILIVSWNTRELLGQCLASVFAHPPAGPCEVLVVDNGSRDGSAALVRERFPQVKLVEARANLGFARANNLGLSLARGRYLLLLNSDTLVLPGTLDRLIACADRHPEAGVLGGRLLNADGSLQASWARFPTLWSELLGRNVRARCPLGRPAGQAQVYDVDWVGGACMLVRPQAVAQVGALDEDFFMYSEETDWCYRMRRHGWRVHYLADGPVVHLGGGSASRADGMQLTRLYEGKLRFFRKHYGPRQAQLLRVGLVAVKGFGLAPRAALRLLRGSAPARQGLAAQWSLARWLLSGTA